MVGWLVGWMVGWLVWFVDWLIGWLVGWLIGWLVDWLVGWLDGGMVGWWNGWVGGWAGWLVGWLVGWLAGWLGSLVSFLFVCLFVCEDSVLVILCHGQRGSGTHEGLSGAFCTACLALERMRARLFAHSKSPTPVCRAEQSRRGRCTAFLSLALGAHVSTSWICRSH